MSVTILVTGSTGFLGSALVEQLCASGTSHVRCFIRPHSDTTKLQHLQSKYPSTTLEYVVGNLLSATDAMRATAEVDTVYHLAAEMRGPAPSVFANTVLASKNLLEGIAKHNVRRVVLASSICVYGLSALPRRAAVTEDAVLEKNPEKRDVYTFAKVKQEYLFQQYRKRSPFELVTLRPGVIYGEGANALPSRAGLRLGNWVLEIAGKSQLPLTYISNCAAAVAFAGRRHVPEGTYNILDDELPTVADYVRLYQLYTESIVRIRVCFSLAMLFACLLEEYRAHSKGQIPAVLTPYRLKSTWGGHTFSNEKIKKVGWTPSVSTNDGILRALRASSRKPTAASTTLVSPLRPSLARSEN